MFKFLRKNKYWLMILILGFNYHLTLPINAQSTYEESSFFRKSPRLISVTSKFKSTRVISDYLFVIEVPKNAGNSLQLIVINQQKNLETIKFYPDEIQAFINDKNGKEIKVKSNLNLDHKKDQNELKIVLLESIKPGEKVMIVVKARNPNYGGIYQFGVTVFPEGDNPKSLYLGIGRIHFTSPGRIF